MCLVTGRGWSLEAIELAKTVKSGEESLVSRAHMGTS